MKYTERTKAEQIVNAYFDMGAGWAESGGLLRDLREMEQGYLKQLADAQATVEALQAQLVTLKRHAELDCGDQSCLYALAHSGMRTNGGCRCSPKRMKDDLERSRKAVEALQARLSELQGVADEKCRCFLERAEQAEKQLTQRTAEVEALQRDNRTYINERHENMKQLEELRQQVEALQRERDEAHEELVTERGRHQELERELLARAAQVNRDTQAALDAEREKLKVMTESKVRCWNQWTFAEQEVKEHAETIEGLQSELSQLQSLVRALPIYEADALITVDGDLDEIDRPALRSAVMELLAYRATLDATTPAPRQRQVHSCEIPGCVSCANPEEGGDGE